MQELFEESLCKVGEVMMVKNKRRNVFHQGSTGVE